MCTDKKKLTADYKQIANKKTIIPQEGFSEVLRCITPNGQVKAEIYLQNETIWLSQQKIADLFVVDRTFVAL